jgi:hypothetical protein
MGTFFCDAKRCILVDFLPRREVVNVGHYIEMLQQL